MDEDDAGAQLQSEAASSQAEPRSNDTPRRDNRVPPSSSPMFYRSSSNAPGDNAARDVSSPLRQMTNTQSTNEDGDRTPRASRQLVGGK
jgi:DNA replication licensing factor MCM4